MSVIGQGHEVLKHLTVENLIVHHYRHHEAVRAISTGSVFLFRIVKENKFLSIVFRTAVYALQFGNIILVHAVNNHVLFI